MLCPYPLPRSAKITGSSGNRARKGRGGSAQRRSEDVFVSVSALGLVPRDPARGRVMVLISPVSTQRCEPWGSGLGPGAQHPPCSCSVTVDTSGQLLGHLLRPADRSAAGHPPPASASGRWDLPRCVRPGSGRRPMFVSVQRSRPARTCLPPRHWGNRTDGIRVITPSCSLVRAVPSCRAHRLLPHTVAVATLLPFFLF